MTANPRTPSLAQLGRQFAVNAGGESQEVWRLAASGQKIQAIKHLREETGMGLKEAKDVVDRL
ncbi:ribosomal protein L7/L12 [Mycobacterium sp. PDNC021]|uniref:ribosomal protein L7/L12 n=1 Tax=Mycobacterium sp. PDNC021 TaxID=3391399 RepID=UPI003AACB246